MAISQQITQKIVFKTALFAHHKRAIEIERFSETAENIVQLKQLQLFGTILRIRLFIHVPVWSIIINYSD